MKKLFLILSLFLVFTAINQIEARDHYVAITASNDPSANALLILNSEGKLLKTLPTQGAGGVSGNAGGITTYDNLIAVVNFNSSSVSIFKYRHCRFVLTQVIPTLSNPVSVVFGYDHLYVLGTTLVESHPMDSDGHVSRTPDGVATLLVGDGSAAQVQVLDGQLLITEKSSMVEVAVLSHGILTGTIAPIALPFPPNFEPFGTAVRNKLGYISIANLNGVAVVKDDEFKSASFSLTQHSPCWLAITGHWLFSSNSPSHSVTRYKLEGKFAVLDKEIVAQTQGTPIDIASGGNIIVLIDHGTGISNVNQYQVTKHGDFALINTTAIAAPSANGAAVFYLID